MAIIIEEQGSGILFNGNLTDKQGWVLSPSSDQTKVVLTNRITGLSGSSAVTEVEVDGSTFADYDALVAALGSVLFKNGGGTGAGVQSVNGDTGPDVVLDAGDIGAATTAQGLLADTAVQPSELQNVVQVSANKTLELTENLSFQNVTAASTITIPDNASVAFPIGAEITVALESGTATIAAASGVTTISLNNNLTLDTIGQVAVLKKTGTDTWFIGINGGA